MMTYLTERTITLKWVKEKPGKNKKAALLIPHYNELNNCNFESRLAYFCEKAQEYMDELDVILIDDGSTDNSLEAIKAFFLERNSNLYIAAVYPNANKVGALYLTASSIEHEFVILSDFDTDIIGVKELLNNTSVLRDDDSLMGCYFRMLPFEGAGSVFLYQQLEYSLARIIYQFHKKEKSIRVMPGAGSCFKREVLVAIYGQHSGLRSGEDREATLIGLKLGYKTVYMDKVLALTRPPLSLKALINQRIRWNLGYLETFYKERVYYYRQIKAMSRIGMVTLMDILTIVFIVLLPFILLMVTVNSWMYLVAFAMLLYILAVSWCFNILLLSPGETAEFKRKRSNSVFSYPVLKLFVDYFSWMGAIIAFIRKGIALRSAAK